MLSDADLRGLENMDLDFSLSPKGLARLLSDLRQLREAVRQHDCSGGTVEALREELRVAQDESRKFLGALECANNSARSRGDRVVKLETNLQIAREALKSIRALTLGVEIDRDFKMRNIANAALAKIGDRMTDAEINRKIAEILGFIPQHVIEEHTHPFCVRCGEIKEAPKCVDDFLHDWSATGTLLERPEFQDITKIDADVDSSEKFGGRLFYTATFCSCKDGVHNVQTAEDEDLQRALCIGFLKAHGVEGV